MSDRSLLVISYHHPPDGAIGGMRWAGLTRYLAELGWNSRLITAAQGARSPGSAGAVTVISCPRRRTLNDLYKRWRAGKGGAARSTGPGGPGGPAPNGGGDAGWVARLRFEAGMLLALPDDARGWIVRAAARARREIARQRPHVVVSTGPPHSAHFVAWLATRRLNPPVPWLVDLRDPWAGPLAEAWRSSALYRSVAARWLVPRLERRVLGTADGVLCNTREFAAALAGRYPDTTIEWIPNGVDRAALPASGGEAPFDGLAIAYLGTIYGGRTLEPVLRALRLFLDRHPTAAADGTRLRVAGQVDRALGPALPADVAALGLAGHVEHLGLLPRDAALRLAARSRLALVLAQHQSLQVPAKLYELVALGTPTLVIAEPGSAARSEAHRLGAAAVAADVPAIAQAMETAWRGRAAVPSAAGNGAVLDYRDVARNVDAVLRRHVP